MKKRHRGYKILLALLLTSSYVILSGHVASHVKLDTTACVLCISHGSAASAIPTTTLLIAVNPASAVRDKNPNTARLQTAVIVHNPARAPPFHS